MKNVFLMLSMVLATTACAVQPDPSTNADDTDAQTSSTESDIKIQPKVCTNTPTGQGLWYECDSDGFDFCEWYSNAFTCQAACGGRICSADWICDSHGCRPN